MSEVLLPMVEEEWKMPPAGESSTASEALRAQLDRIGAAVLRSVQAHGVTSLRQLIEELGWPAPLVTMAVGALVCDGDVRATPCHLDGIVDLVPAAGVPVVLGLCGA